MKTKSLCTRKIWIGLGLLLFVSWLIWVVSYNHRLKERDLRPVQNYPMGATVELGNNYCYGDYFDGVSICANDYRIIDTDTYLGEKGLSADDFGWLTDKICIVDITIRYQATEEQWQAAEGKEDLYTDVDMSVFFMLGQDYYEGQNTELYSIENPKSNGNTGIRFHDGDECNVKLVFNLDKRYYTSSSWEHIEELPRMLYITASPIQQNIVLHD